MWRLFTLTLVFPPLFVALALSAIYIGNTIGVPPSALAGLDDCALPCWHGITPRGTLFELADGVLLSAGYERSDADNRFRVILYRPAAGTTACNVGVNYGGGAVIAVTLSNCAGVRLGDLMAILDAPGGIVQNGRALTFRQGRIIVRQLMLTCDDWFSPLSEVFAIYLNNPGPPPRRAVSDYDASLAYSAFAWRGFATRAAYESAEPGFPVCE
jgi:hypothetical protein